MRQALIKSSIIVVITLLILLFYANYSQHSNVIHSIEEEIQIPATANSSQINVSEDEGGNQYQGISINKFKPSLWLREQFDLILVKAKDSKLEQIKHLAALHRKMKLSQGDYKSIMSLFNRYHEYKLNILSDKKSITPNNVLPDIEDNYQIIERLKHYQTRYFSNEEISAFFADEMHYHKQALSRMAITSDDTLSKSQALDVLEAAIRTQDIAQQEAFLPSIKVARMLQALNDDSVYLPEMTLEAEERFLTFKGKHQHWQNRVKDFIKKVETIKSKQNDLNEVQHNINQLKAKQFKPEEMQRLDVFLRHPTLITSS
jgi:lipase chaperone LimK